MAKKRRKRAASVPSSNGESIAGYFRKVFAAAPKLLKAAQQREGCWIAGLVDHPGEQEVPDLGQEQPVQHQERLTQQEAQAAEGQGPPLARSRHSRSPLRSSSRRPRSSKTLEEQIDDCLTAARKHRQARPGGM